MAQTEINAHIFQVCSMCKKYQGIPAHQVFLISWAGQRDTEVPRRQYWYHRGHLDVTCSPEGRSGTIRVPPVALTLQKAVYMYIHLNLHESDINLA